MLHDQDLVSVQEVRQKVELAWQAFQAFQSYSQAQVDAIVEALGAAGRAHARQLAEMAVEETGMGNVEDKTVKNLLNADLLVRSIRGVKTIGILRERPEDKVIEVGVGVGVVAAILPTTNPTSTAIYKSVISLKAGNAVVLSPHPRAKNSTCSTAAVLIDAARKAGAPEGIIQCIHNPSLDGTNALMRHPKTGVILSTGGAGIVRAAYSSGTPAFGVGPGNVPVLLDTSYDVAQAVAKVVAGKMFDYGTVCSSEQVLVAENSIRGRVLDELKKQKAFLLNDAQRAAIEKTLFTHGTTVRPECVGQSPRKIAQMAGFEIPADASILVAEIGGVGKEHPLSARNCRRCGVMFVDSFDSAPMPARKAALRRYRPYLRIRQRRHEGEEVWPSDAGVPGPGNRRRHRVRMASRLALQPSMTLGAARSQEISRPTTLAPPLINISGSPTPYALRQRRSRRPEPLRQACSRGR